MKRIAFISSTVLIMVTDMLYLIHKKEAFFVVREKHKMVFKIVNDKSYNNPDTGVMADQIIMLIVFSGDSSDFLVSFIVIQL